MKTLHLTCAWHETSGGIATFYRQLIAAANAKRHAIRLVVPAEKDSVEEAGPYGRIYHLASPKAPLNSAYRIIYPTQFIFAGSKIQQILDHERPDLVEICDKYNLNYLGGLLRERLLELTGFRPIVVGLSCERMDDNLSAYLGGGFLAKHFSRIYMRWLYFPMFDHHITVSDHTAAELAPASKGHPVHRGVWVRHMGVDTARFSADRRSPEAHNKLTALASPASQDPDQLRLLLYAGRLVPEKNLNLLIEMMECLPPECHLLIAGQGMEEPRLRELADSRVPGRVHFLGFVGSKEELASLYANCDAFIHPNPREPFGIAPLEAMASGLPLVAPNSGGVVSYANPENAWVVEPTASAFAGAVKELLGDAALRALKTNRALETVAQYSWPSMAARFLELYGEMLRLKHEDPNGAAIAPAFVSVPPPGGTNKTARQAARTAASILAVYKRWKEPRITSAAVARFQSHTTGDEGWEKHI
ncbi:MAG TPA: glycosyltransferase family 4 protein [Candidatus Angelobacter sp.]|nr:glycosyltransferase family 4 protein [Candidatus Angelobacter sp.]